MFPLFSVFLSQFSNFVSCLKPEIEEAQNSSEATIEFVNEIRPPTIKDNFFMKLFVKNNFEGYNDGKIALTHVEYDFN